MIERSETEHAPRRRPRGSARRQLVAGALGESLRNIRESVAASHVLLIKKPASGGREPAQLLASSSAGGPKFEPNEPVRLSGSDSGFDDLLVRSLMRDLTLHLVRPVVTHLSNTESDVVLVLASASKRSPTREHVLDVSKALQQATNRLAVARRDDVSAAYRVVAHALAGTDMPTERSLDLVLAAARHLLDSDAAYLSVPANDRDFVFSRMLGIGTRQFRQLRVGPGEGLGGRARLRTVPVRSVDYGSDNRFDPTIRDVTEREGLYSAVAVPIMSDDQVEAVLYVANRTPAAYTRADAAMLGDFADAALLSLESLQLADHRREVLAQQERQRIAGILHDQIGRQLTRMSLAVQGLEDADGPSLSRDVEALSASVTACMAEIRKQITDLEQETNPQTHDSLGEVMHAICATPSLGLATRMTTWHRGDAVASPTMLVPSEYARVLIDVGQEAVFNAEQHSGGGRCDVAMFVADRRLHLTVTDNGPGTIEDDQRGHGTSSMQYQADRIGASLTITSPTVGGTRVTLTLPPWAGMAEAAMGAVPR